MNLETYLQASIEEIDRAIDEWLPAETRYPQVLNQAMRYSLFAKGKRLRPILLLTTAEALSGRRQEFLPAACAIEMIHTYSLIHDDLPAMDDDDLRRGIPTNHKVFGEANAMLAGDALLTHAFYVLAAMPLEGRDQDKLAIIRELSLSAGLEGMIRGQVADLLNEGQLASEQMLEFIHRNKTGALLQAAVRIGAILGGASDKQLAVLTEYADNIGLAFQIVDDILDVEGDTSILGKNVGSDETACKSTFVSLYGLAASKNKAQELIDQAHALLQSADLSDATRLAEIADYVIHRVW